MKAREIALATSANAMVFRRWAGAWIDFLFGFGIMVLVAEVLLAGRNGGLIFLADAILLAAYFIGMEVAVGGTLGKLLTGIRVVDGNGRNPSFKAALIRTLLRLVEVNPFLLGGLPAGLVVNYSKTKQRLGDMAAGTFVLKRRDLLASSPGR